MIEYPSFCKLAKSLDFIDHQAEMVSYFYEHAVNVQIENKNIYVLNGNIEECEIEICIFEDKFRVKLQYKDAIFIKRGSKPGRYFIHGEEKDNNYLTEPKSDYFRLCFLD